jgi:hypothetical protein
VANQEPRIIGRKDDYETGRSQNKIGIVSALSRGLDPIFIADRTHQHYAG